MADDARMPAELRARLDAAGFGDADARGLAAAAADHVHVLLDLIESRRGVREAGSGLNAASSELLVADALLTEAAARAAAVGALDDVLRAFDLDALAERAAQVDGEAA